MILLIIVDDKRGLSFEGRNGKFETFNRHDDPQSSWNYGGV